MKIFNRKKETKSLDMFKQSSDALNTAEAVEKITGGTLSGCHTGGKGMIFDSAISSISSVSLGRVSLAGFDSRAIAGL